MKQIQIFSLCWKYIILILSFLLMMIHRNHQRYIFIKYAVIILLNNLIWKTYMYIFAWYWYNIMQNIYFSIFFLKLRYNFIMWVAWVVQRNTQHSCNNNTQKMFWKFQITSYRVWALRTRKRGVLGSEYFFFISDKICRVD